MQRKNSDAITPRFERPADGYEILVTWPDFREGHHDQEIWYANVSDQAEAVRLVQQACGALNDAKIEILAPAAEAFLANHVVRAGEVKRATSRFSGA